LATQVLIKNAFVESLESEINDLHFGIYDLAGVVRTWGIKDHLEESEEWMAEKLKATTAHNKSRLFLRARKGCYIVQEMKGQDQIDEAKKLIGQGTLPEKLLSALRGVISRCGSQGNFQKRAPEECTALVATTPPSKKQKAACSGGLPMVAPSSVPKSLPGAPRPVARRPRPSRCSAK